MLSELWLEENANVVILPDNSSIFQHKQGQKISSDNVDFNSEIMAYYKCQANQPKQVLELGIGNGINSIMLKKRFPSWSFTGIEIDQDQADLAVYNCSLQNVMIDIIADDLRAFANSVKYDLIIANPPYQKNGVGRQSKYERNNIAKIELTCTMKDVFLALKRNLSTKGEAWLLYSQDREEDLLKYINQEQFKIIDMIRKNKIVIAGMKYATN